MGTKLVKGTALVSLADGAELGTVDRVYLDPRRREVVAIAFHRGGGLFGGGAAGMVEADDVRAFGPDAVTVGDRSAVRSDLAVAARCGDLIDLEDLLRRGVITEGGARLGQVAGVRFGQDSHRLTAIEVARGAHDRKLIGADAIRVIGSDLIVVADTARPALTRAAGTRPVPRVAVVDAADRRLPLGRAGSGVLAGGNATGRIARGG